MPRDAAAGKANRWDFLKCGILALAVLLVLKEGLVIYGIWMIAAIAFGFYPPATPSTVTDTGRQQASASAKRSDRTVQLLDFSRLHVPFVFAKRYV